MDEWDKYVEEKKADAARHKRLRFAAEAGLVWSVILFPLYAPIVWIISKIRQDRT